MFRESEIRRNSLKHQLRSILNDYSDLAASDPDILRLSIPENEIWRFSVDGVDQGDGWIDYEDREKGYLSALYLTFNEIFNLKTDLTNNYIKHLHDAACKGVKNTNYAANSEFMIDEYRDDYSNGIYVMLHHHHHSGNCSADGIYEYLKKSGYPGSQHIIKIEIPLPVAPYEKEILVNADYQQSVPELRELPAKYSRYALSSRFSTALDTLKTLPDNPTLLQFAQTLIKLIDDPYCLLYMQSQQENTNDTLNRVIQNHIDSYHREMARAKNKLDKLLQIVIFIRNCEQTHPFADGNCRTFCMLLLNHLLIKNGFPLAILPDPNRFDMCSIDELVNDVITGMRNTMSLIRNKKLHGIETDGLLARYENSHHKRLLAFNNVVAHEEEARVRPAKKRMRC